MPKSRKKIRWLIGCLFVLTPLLLFPLLLVRMLRDDPKPLHSLAEITKVTRVTFPPDSVLLDGVACRCWNAYLYARIRIPPEKIPQFWSQPLFRGNVSTQANQLAFSLPPEARHSWGLHQVKDFRASEGGNFNQEGLSNALVSLDDPANPVLYLYWAHN